VGGSKSKNKSKGVTTRYKGVYRALRMMHRVGDSVCYREVLVAGEVEVFAYTVKTEIEYVLGLNDWCV
jgi:hypothetical protein